MGHDESAASRLVVAQCEDGVIAIMRGSVINVFKHAEAEWIVVSVN